MGKEDFKLSTTLAILLATCILSCSSCREVCIASTQDSSKHCEVLEECCANTQRISVSDDVRIIILSGKHSLSSSCIFNGTNNLTLKGQSATIIECSHQDSGFIFYNVSSLMISDIVFIDCGANWNGTQPVLNGLFPEIQAALLFLGGSDHTLSNVIIRDAQVCWNLHL